MFTLHKRCGLVDPLRLHCVKSLCLIIIVGGGCGCFYFLGKLRKEYIDRYKRTKKTFLPVKKVLKTDIGSVCM